MTLLQLSLTIIATISFYTTVILLLKYHLPYCLPQLSCHFTPNRQQIPPWEDDREEEKDGHQDTETGKHHIVSH